MDNLQQEGEHKMQFMILAVESEEDFANRDLTGAAFEAYMTPWMAYSTEMAEAGVTVSGAALQKPETATTVKVRDGKRIMEDGPFADAKEQLGGFFIIEAPDMDTAKQWAAKCPSTKTGVTEVRELMVLPEEFNS
jgi:hypothetical protein